MTEIKLHYIDNFTDRFGRRHYYFRRGKGPRVPLEGEPGSLVFVAGYNAALAESGPKKPVPRVVPAAGSFAALAAAYYASAYFKDLSDSSKVNYRRIIDEFCRQHGHRKVAQMKRAHVIKIIGDMAERPGAAIVLLKRIRTLINFAIELEWIAIDPTKRVRSYDSTEFHTLTEQEIAQFEARWPLGTRKRLAFDTMLYTGQRVSDAHLMPLPDKDGKMRFQQKKTGQWMVLRAHRRLKESIAACDIRGTVINLTAYGQSFSTKGFSQFVSAAMRGAGLPSECVPHSLRKAAARRLAEIGCSPHEIMALTGHKTLSEVERYTRAAEQERLNERATAKHEAMD